MSEQSANDSLRSMIAEGQRSREQLKRISEALAAMRSEVEVQALRPCDFTPQRDITAWELAAVLKVILEAFYATPELPRATIEAMHPNVRRHLTVRES